MKAVDITGIRFKRLVAIEPTSARYFHKVVWLCHCDCDNDTFATPTELKTGNTQSCGCYPKDNMKGNKFGFKHGISLTPRYNFKHNLKKNHNLTLDQYNKMVLKSEGKCDICVKQSDLVVDHDHTTGKIRGLLCQDCNTRLGSYEIMKILPTELYLERSSCKI